MNTNSATDHHQNELEILNAIAQALNRSVDLDQAMASTLDHVAELFDLETGWIWLINEDTDEFYLAAARKLPPALTRNPARMEGTCYCIDSYLDGALEDAENVDIITCTRLQNLTAGTDGLLYHATVPLYAHGKPLGMLNVADTDWRELSEADLRLLFTVGDLLSIAIERARLYAQSVDIGAVNERNRLAREIHDTLAQSLSAILLQLETADALLETQQDRDRAQERVRSAIDLARNSLDEARRSVVDLRAAPLEGRTLAAALQDFVAAAAERTGIPIAMQSVGAARPLSPALEAGLYRVAQEALNNVQRHADAGHARLLLATTPAEVTLLIEDDGRGFDPAQTPANRFGLTGMNERVKLLGGTLRIESCPGKGTLVMVCAPFEPSEKE